MQIKTKILASSGFLLLLCLIAIWVTIGAFSQLSEQLELVAKEAQTTAKEAQSSATLSTRSASEVDVINQQILAIVDGINNTNQRAKLTSKKVKDISASLQELTELIEELSEDVSDQDAQEILEEISDEIADIEERTRREALPNLTASSDSIHAFNQQIGAQASKVSALTQSMNALNQQAAGAVKTGETISQQSKASIETLTEQEVVLLSIMVLLAVVALLSAAIMFKTVINPISNTVSLMRDVAEGEGDLSRRLKSSGEDEMASIAAAFNRFVEKVQSMVAGVASSSATLQQSSQTALNEMQSSDQALQQQLKEIEQIATAVEQMNATTLSVAQSAVDAASATSNANQQLAQGKETVTSAQGAVSELVSEMSIAVQVIQTLDEKSQDISRVVDVITAVAEQTNLLALNAAIEAARAGEQGRGFAVVADEVRGLAGKAESSANDIRSIVAQVQEMTSKAVNAMQTSQAACDHTVEGTQEVFHVLDKIAKSIDSIDQMNAQIASAAEQESGVSEDVNRRIVNVNEFSRGTANGVSTTVSACEQVSQTADEIHQQLSLFKV